MNRKLIEVTRSNETSANLGIALILAAGLSLSSYGAKRWYQKIQLRDDRLAALQIEKLEAEICKLRSEIKPLISTPDGATPRITADVTATADTKNGLQNSRLI